jgi:hypothetical protein
VYFENHYTKRFLTERVLNFGMKSLDRSVGIQMGQMLEGQGSIPVRDKNCSTFHSVQASSEPDPMDTGDLYLEVKRPERKAAHLPPSSAEVKNG